MNALGNWTLTYRNQFVWLAIFACITFAGVVLAVQLSSVLQFAALITGERVVLADYFSAAVLAMALGMSVILWPISSGDKGRLLVLWIIKIYLVLLILPAYEAHYRGALDAYMYFGTGALDQQSLPPLVFGDGTSVVIWLLHWVTAILPAYFHLLEMLWSFVGLIAIYAFYRGWRWLIPGIDSRFLLWIGLFPSVFFWSSILGKDPFCLLGVGLYFYAIARWWRSREKRLLIVAAIGVLIATVIRPWYALILVAPIVAFALTGRRVRAWQKLVILTVVAIGTFFAAQTFLTSFDISNTSSLIHTANLISHSWATGGSAVQTSQFHTGLGMLEFLPLGMFTALFRPLPGEVGNVLGLLSSVMSVVLLAVTTLAVIRTPLRALRSPWLLWVVLLILVWSIMYAYPSSQNLGTASRFQLQILPVLWPLVLLGAVRRPYLGLAPLKKTLEVT